MKLKKLVLLMAALILAASLLPGYVHAAEIVDSGMCGGGLFWQLDDEGTLTITNDGTGSGEMFNFQVYPAPWETYYESITKIVLEEGVTNISDGAFSMCKNATSVQMKSVVAIGENAFNSCWNLTDITWSAVEEIGSGAFAGCDALTEVTLPEGVTVLKGGTFAYCAALETVNLGNVTEIGDGAFQECPVLKEVTMEKVTSLGDKAFYRCYKLENATLPEVQTIGAEAFYNCDGLKTVTADKLTTLDNAAFYWCASLESISMNSLETVGANAFEKCEVLAEVSLPAATDVGEAAFRESGVVSAKLPKVTTVGVDAFRDCKVLTEIELDSVTEIKESAFHNASGLSRVVMPQVVTLWDGAFWNCSSLEEVELPDTLKVMDRNCFRASGVKSIVIPASVVSFDNWVFLECTKLEEVTIEGSVKLGNSVFEGCTALKSVSMEQVTGVGSNAFGGCTALQEVQMPAVQELGGGAFAGCVSLTEIRLDKVQTIENSTFSGCTGLKSVSCPLVTEIDYHAFTGCTVLESLETGTLTKLGSAAFSGCSSLTSVDLGALTVISTYTFQNCTALSYVLIPETVTTIEYHVFEGCTALETIMIPMTVTELGSALFEGCENLKEIWFEGNAPAFNDLAGWPILRGTSATVYYPAGNESWTSIIQLAYGGDVTWKEYEPEVFRISGSNRFDTAFQVADQMKENLGVEKFDAIIIASGTNFADALSGSYLAAVKNAPILLSYNEAYNLLVKNYVWNNLAMGGTVYILGGAAAVPESMETGLNMYHVVRLNGANRFETNLMILRTAGVEPMQEILVCTGTNFADSLSASATGRPILLVFNEGGKLFDNQKEYLAAHTDNSYCILGGEYAVSQKLEDAITSYGVTTQRLAGKNRFETSVLVAEKYFSNPESAVLAYAWNYPDGLCGGGLAYSMHAPLILTMTGYESAAADYAKSVGISKGVVLGGTRLISNAAVRNIFNMEVTEPVSVK